MNFLVLDSSIMPLERSGSRPLVAAMRDALAAKYPDALVRYRDLDAERLPHAGLALFAPPSDGAASLSSVLIGELVAADIVVIGAPLYNFTIPSTLKAWLDHVVIAGKTFRYMPNGLPEGLLRGKTVFICSSRGGIYSHGPMAGHDFVLPYLRAALGFIGLTNIHTVVAEGLSMGPEPRAASLAQAKQQALALAAAA